MAALAHLLGLGDFHERFEIDRLRLPFSRVRQLLFGGWDRQLGPVSIGDERLPPVLEDRVGLGGWRRSLIHESIDGVGFLSTAIILIARQLRLDGERDLRFAT